MPIPALAAGAIASIAGTLLKHGLNRADYNYTREMTSPRQQVADLKAAGLNPALAYSQLQAAQGQTLTPGDGSELGQLVQNSPLIKKQIEAQEAAIQTQEAQRDYYRALAFKTGEEGKEAEFRVGKQEELYSLDFIFKGLQNEKTSSEVRGIRLHNSWQEIENEIHKIDWQKHDRFVEAQIEDLVKSAGLKIAMTTTENQLRKYKVAQIKSDLSTAIYLRRLMNDEHSLNVKKKIGLEYQNTLSRLESGFMQFLTKNGADFSTLNARQRFNTYGPAIINGVSDLISTGVSLIPMVGLTKGVKGLGNLNRGIGRSNYVRGVEDYYHIDD